MSAINFKKLPMSKRDFEVHFAQKAENAKWMGCLYGYLYGTGMKLKDIAAPFEAFPYRWDVKKSQVHIEKLVPFGEDYTEFDGEKTSYIISIPYHQASVKEIQQIVKAIEDQSFGKTPKVSRGLVQQRVAIVLGLNNCHSFNPDKNDRFKTQISDLNHATLNSHVSLTVLPFFWGYRWVMKTSKTLGFKFIPRHIFTIHACYRIANSYFRAYRGGKENLWISDQFKQTGSPEEKTIPYQSIRDRILHSGALKEYFESSPSKVKYILSIDGDFLSLKSADSSTGLLSHYDAIIQNHYTETGEYPSVVSTGYEPPEDEENALIKLGIEQDRSIRAAMEGKFVYMPEPNFAFRMKKTQDLARLSWVGGTTMDTESRRLIANGIAKGIFDSDHFVFSNKGGVQTAIDEAWRTTTVVKYQDIEPSALKQKGVQKAIRGLHQSYADPQIWANNVYTGLQVTVSAYMKDAIVPLKAMRELFDPITLRQVRYGADQTHASDFKNLFAVYSLYLELMRNSVKKKNSSQLVAEFFNQANISGKKTREGWEIFLKLQLQKFQECRELLRENYSQAQVQEVIEAAIATGEAIKEFYASNI